MQPDPAQILSSPQPSSTAGRHSRAEISAKVLNFEEARRVRGLTQQAAADELGVARATVLGWCDRVAQSRLSLVQRAFFESPEGIRFLRTLFVAALLVLSIRGGLGVGIIRIFFTITGLSSLIACSETTLLRARRTMIAAIGTWGDAQDLTLAALMSSKSIMLCVDENFHEMLMMHVAIEPVSGFIALETYAKCRDGRTWAQGLRNALARWPVCLVGITADEAKGLIRCAIVELGVPKGSDLFHVQHAVCRASASVLARHVRDAETRLETAREELAAIEAARALAADHPRDTDNAALMAAQAVSASKKVTDATARVAVAEAEREGMRQAVCGLGDCYHPVDVDTGAGLSPETVAERLKQGFTKIHKAAEAAGISSMQRVREGLAKAERVLPSLVGMVHAWHRLATERIAALGLSAVETAWIWAVLLPTIYLDRIAPQGRDKEIRARLRALRDGLVSKVMVADSPWNRWSAETQARVQGVVESCVDLFVRTSSCVEGRNGQLALYHHRLHALSPQLLKALTVLHNYVLTRSDGTTAAERFTCHPHESLFQHLVEVTPVPARPRVRKSEKRAPLFAVV